MLEVDNVSAGYGHIQALENVSLKLEKGQVVCLLGANGAGKTTMLNCISGIVRSSSGRISFMGQDIVGESPSAIVRRGVLQVPEGREIFRSMTVYDNLLLGGWTKGRRLAGANLERIFSLFPVLKQRQKQAAGTLSGGEQQMLMIGRALICDPKVLMFDEPSLGLSPVLVKNVFNIIRQLHSDGIPILIVEQNARLALATSDYGYILENGEIKFHGPASALAQNPAVQEAYLGA